MNGVLLVDKPEGWTSHDVCQFVKKRFRPGKVGHAGTLDPCATGLLVLLVGRATKMSLHFSSQVKSYEGTMVLGVKTDTQDREGRVLARGCFDNVTSETIGKAINSFIGEGEQLPPMASAIKHRGIALHRLFRRGEEVEREARPITVYSFDLINVRLPYVDFSCTVSKGTYVRTLVNDVGEKLGSCAYLESLRRTLSGPFSISQCVTVDALRTLPNSEALRQYLQNCSHESFHSLTTQG